MAATENLVAYYVNLLILQYHGKDRAKATINLGVTSILADQLPIQIEQSFGVDDAEGVQLDILAKYTGVQRRATDFAGPVTLSDDNLRILMKVAILQNNSGSSLSDIQNLINIFFKDTLFVFDYKDMTMSYFLDSNEASLELAEVFITGDHLPRPMGVRLRPLLFVPSIDNWFGFRTTAAAGFNNHGFNTTAQYDTDCHWLNTGDVVSL